MLQDVVAQRFLARVGVWLIVRFNSARTELPGSVGGGKDGAIAQVTASLEDTMTVISRIGRRAREGPYVAELQRKRVD